MPSFQILTALSFLSALCTLSAQAVPNDGIMPARQGLAARQMTVSNPLVLPLFPPASKCLVTATSHASFTQKVLIAVTGNKVPIPCIFQGSGEGVNMVNIVSNNTTLCNVAGDSPLRPLPLVFTFQFSVTGTGGPFINTPIVQTSNTSLGTTTLITAQTEDSTDNDLNDSVVNIIVQAPPSSIAVPQAVKSASLASALVESNLSFQPTANITVSVGAFSGNSTLSEFSASTQDWGKVTGEIIDIHQEPIFPNLLLMRFLFSESTSGQPEMQNATLLLNGIVSFRGARPTGTPTSGVGWISELIPGDL